jgi:HlyD family secretion protein
VDGVITYEAVLNVDNADLSLRPGMTATATIVVQEVEDAVLVPNAALRFSPPVEAEVAPRTGLVGRLLPRPPRSDSKHRTSRASESKAQRVWILEDGQPLAVPVVVGASDGFTTELLRGNVEPGTPLIVEATME